MAIIYKNKWMKLLLFSPLFLLIFILSCEKLDIERVAYITTDGFSITGSKVTVSSSIIDMGSLEIIDHGFCWSENKLPTIKDTKISMGKISIKQVFSATLYNITSGKTYYYRAFLNDGTQIIYGEEKTLVLGFAGTQITTSDPIAQNDSSVICEAIITGVGSLSIKDFGHCWDTLPNPVIKCNKTSFGLLSNDTIYSSTLTNLRTQKDYYIRSFLILDSSKVIYGNEKTINISEISVSIDSIKIVTSSSAKVKGLINSIGLKPITNHGHCWSENPIPTISNNKTSFGAKPTTGSFISDLTNLSTEKNIYVRAYASDGIKVKYGEVVSFKIKEFQILSDSVNITSASTANAKADLTIGSYPVDDYGHCWSLNPNPTISDNKTSLGAQPISTHYQSLLNMLSLETTYYVRAYAKEQSTIKYGVTKSFNIIDFTLKSDSITIQSSTNATLYAYIGLGSFAVDDYGFCWATHSIPTVNDNIISNGYLLNSKFYSNTINNIPQSSNIYIKPYARKNMVVKYGNELADYKVFNGAFLKTDKTRGSLNGKITIIGNIQVANYGHCWSITNKLPTISDNKTTQGTANLSKNFISSLTNLEPGTTYYFRAYATDGLTTKYSVTDSFRFPGNLWVQKADFGGTAMRSGVGFSIYNKGYVGIGDTSGYSNRKFWEYDPATNSWSQKADYSGLAWTSAVGFSIGGKGYMGTGSDYSTVEKDFWEYNPITNSWTRKADFGGLPRQDAIGFSINGKGYIGTGYTWSITSGSGVLKDFWEYNPTTDSWSQKADFGGLERDNAIGFSIDGKGYIGTGRTGIATITKDFWEYNPTSNSWSQKADLGGLVRNAAIGFVIMDKGYIGTGNLLNDFWEYNPITNSWSQKADFGGLPRSDAVGFSIGNKGYIGTGVLGSHSNTNDFWEYTP